MTVIISFLWKIGKKNPVTSVEEGRFVIGNYMLTTTQNELIHGSHYEEVYTRQV